MQLSKFLKNLFSRNVTVIQPEVIDEPAKPKVRRLKTGVRKESRKKEGLYPLARDLANSWWNRNQRLVEKKDPVCAMLAGDAQATTGIYVSPLQIAGWFSELCRNGLLTDEERDTVIECRIHKDVFTVRPFYSPELVHTILVNHENQKAEKALRALEHTALKIKRATARAKKLEVGIPQSLFSQEV